MNTKENHNRTQLNVDDIVSRKEVIHPALDWVDGQLIVGVVLKGNKRAVLSSSKGLVPLDGLGTVCERNRNFESPVTPETARAFVAHLQGNVKKGSESGAREVIYGIANHLRRFVVFPDRWWPEVLATWVFGTYLYPIFQAYPYLHITSPEPGCGKSLLGQLLGNLSFNGEFMTSPTEANLFHLPELNRGVQVWDEFELSSQSDRNRFEITKSVLLNGYRNGGAVPRQVGKQWDKTVRYHVFCPRVLIGLSYLPEAASQRTIQLRLRRRSKEQRVTLYNLHDQAAEEQRLRSASVLSALKCASQVKETYMDNRVRKHLEESIGQVGREVDDIWLPLAAIAISTSEDDSAEPKQNPLSRTVGRASIELARRRASSPKGWDRVDASEVAADSHVGSQRVRTSEALCYALDILAGTTSVEPRQLASLVADRIDWKPSVQWLSKNLKKIGIEARKEKGRRVFKSHPDELAEARSGLAVEPIVSQTGTPGQERQQEEKKEEEYIIEL